MKATWLLPLALLAAACSSADPETGAEAGRVLFAQNCASCHGASGRGDGAMAPAGTRPADLTGIAARRGGVWPMLEVMAIVDGYARRVDARPGMPVLPQVTGGPTVPFETGNGMVRDTPANLLAIARYLETLQQPRPARYVP